MLIPLYLVKEMFPMYVMSDLVMWDIFSQVVQENLTAPITLVEEKNAVRLLLCSAMLNNALKNVGIDNIWNSVEILTVHFLVFFIILVAVQLLHMKDLPVLVGRGSLYSVDKSLGYGVGKIGHMFLRLLDTEYSIVAMVQ